MPADPHPTPAALAALDLDTLERLATDTRDARNAYAAALDTSAGNDARVDYLTLHEAFNAACWPERILALLAAARRNETEMQRMREYIDQCDHTILSLNGTIARERTAARRGAGETALWQMTVARDVCAKVAQEQRERAVAAELDTALLDFLAAHPNSVGWATGYHGSAGSWTYTDEQHAVRPVESLREAIRAARAAHPEGPQHG